MSDGLSGITRVGLDPMTPPVPAARVRRDDDAQQQKRRQEQESGLPPEADDEEDDGRVHLDVRA